MAESNQLLELYVNTKLLGTNANAAAAAFRGLDKTLGSLARSIREAFSVKGFTDYKDTVTRFGKDLADELLVLQLRFGRMKYAIAEAVAPLASVFVPMVNAAMQAVIRFSSVVGQFLRGLMAGITGNQALAEATTEAVQGEKQLSAAASAAGKAVRRSLAGFDQLERLSGSTGSGGSGGSTMEELWGGYTQQAILPHIQAAVDKVLALLEPLRRIDLQPLRKSLKTLGESFRTMAQTAVAALDGLWYRVLTPFAAWVVEKLAPVLAEGWAAKFDLITTAVKPLMAGMNILWKALKPIVGYIGDALLHALKNWQTRFEILADAVQKNHPVIIAIFQNLGQAISGMWKSVRPVLDALGNHFDKVFAGVTETVGTTVGYVLQMFQGMSQFLSGTFTGNWKKAWEGIKLLLKSAVNGVITLLNSLINRLVDGLNAVVRAANRLSFTVPSWVPMLGGKRYGVNLPYVSAARIPYLAQGAVLPAGKPFLAMVGDQRHGTNVEAPLSTIQEAVALVMEDQTGAILRGFEASIGVQREILEAVLGIHLGDEVIGQAVSRYQRKMAAVRGG